MALRDFGIQPSPADIEFLKSEPPDPRTILMAPLPPAETIVQQPTLKPTYNLQAHPVPKTLALGNAIQQSAGLLSNVQLQRSNAESIEKLGRI